METNGSLSGKKVLAIGDSITSDGRWQKEFERLTGSTVTTHARGGVGIIDLVFGLGAAESAGMRYDPYTGANRELPPLSCRDVADKDVVIFFGGYNERHMEYGSENDVFPRDDTLLGKYNTVMTRLFELKKESGGNFVTVLISPHCVGRYNWVDADGTEEFPAGSGRTLETMSGVVSRVAEKYGCLFYDAYHESGIGPQNWYKYANSPTVLRSDYDPHGVYEAPYPMYADQAHLNGDGYAKLGEGIARFVCSNTGEIFC